MSGECISFVPMIKIPEYNQVPYTVFRNVLKKQFEDSGKLDIQIALDIKVKTSKTIQNAITAPKQKVSDKALSKIMKAVGMDGVLLYINGSRQYYISTKK